MKVPFIGVHKLKLHVIESAILCKVVAATLTTSSNFGFLMAIL